MPMFVDSEIKAISGELKVDGVVHEDDSYILVGDVKVRFPYCELEYSSDRGYYQSPTVWDSKKCLYDLFTNNLPPEWIPFIKEVGKRRILAGNNTPMDLVTGVGFILEENSEYVKSAGIKPYTKDANDDYDYTNIPDLIGTVNSVIHDKYLGNLLVKNLTIQIFDQGGNWDSNNTINKIFKDLAFQGKIVLDIGVGTGRKTVERFKETGVNTVAIDRQYHPLHYGEYWKNVNPKIQFIRSDAAEGIPLPTRSVDFALMECVVPHITQKSLENMLQETARVLKDNGVLIVGPEEEDWEDEEYCAESRWRYYIKVSTNNAFSLKQIRLSEVSRIVGKRSYEEDYLL